MSIENEDPALFDQIVAAARRCFARYGVDRTTMNDIAKEAGIGRTGVYRTGLTRPEITEAAIVSRIKELAEDIKPIAERDAPFADLLLETSIATVDAGRSDPELGHLLDTTTTVSLHRLIAGHGSVTQSIVQDVLGCMLQRGREQKAIRADISDDRAIEWLRGIYLMLMLREDLDADSERALIADFVVPSLTNNIVVAANAVSSETRKPSRRGSRR